MQHSLRDWHAHEQEWLPMIKACYWILDCAEYQQRWVCLIIMQSERARDNIPLQLKPNKMDKSHGLIHEQGWGTVAGGRQRFHFGLHKTLRNTF